MKRTEKINIFISVVLGIAIVFSVAGCIIVENGVLFIVFWIFAVMATVAFIVNILCMKEEKDN